MRVGLDSASLDTSQNGLLPSAALKQRRENFLSTTGTFRKTVLSVVAVNGSGLAEAMRYCILPGSLLWLPDG